MRKYMFLPIAVIQLALFSSCSNNAAESVLPKPAQTLIADHFPKQGIKEIEETKNKMNYEVTLDDGTKLDFNTLGEWEEVNFKYNDVPPSFLKSLPSAIVDYVQNSHPDDGIHKIEKKHFGRKDYIYRITFQKPNDIELTFSKNGDLISNDPEGQHLPSAARSFINKHYSDANITSIMHDVDGDYDICLDETIEISFDRKGNWFFIKNYKKNQFPKSILDLLPKTALQYIEKNYPDQYVRRIERKSYGYRVKLNKPNNVEITFSKNGEFKSLESKSSDIVDE